MNNLPLYQVVLNQDDDRVEFIALVEDPAVESNFQLFSSDKPQCLLKLSNEEKHEVLGVVLRANYKIYRRDDDGYEYDVVFSPDVIKQITQKFLKENRNSNINLHHDLSQKIDSADLLEIFIKDEKAGINPKGFEDITNGSLFARYKINDQDVWNKIKSGELNGFSVEGYFTYEQSERSDEDEILDLIKQLSDKLK